MTEGQPCPVLCVVYEGAGTVTRSVKIVPDVSKVEAKPGNSLPKLPVRRSSLARRATFADVGFLTIGQSNGAETTADSSEKTNTQSRCGRHDMLVPCS